MKPHPFDLTGTFQLAVRGDRQATILLVEYYRSRLIKDLEGTVHPKLEARLSLSDVLQDLCVQLLNSKKKNRCHKDNPLLIAIPESSKGAYTWIRKLAGRRVIDHYRKHLGTQMRDVRRERPLCDSDSSGAESLRRFDRPCALVNEPPSEPLREFERRMVIKNAIDQLSPIYREVILLKVYHGYSTAKIAEHMGVSQATVSKRYIRGLEIMKQFPGVRGLP
ncbi:MAG: sigma-70 family RNA polymerase sigma factor [Pirellula sp.]